MLKILRVFVGVGVALAAVGLNVGVSHATPDGEWSTFENVPGLVAAHPNGGSVNSVSCASPGNCSAVGYYSTNSGFQAFVVSQVDGVWGSFEDVPGLVAVNTGQAIANSVSCASPGNCSAVGYYSNNSGNQAFVVSQVDGVWGSFEDVAGLVTAHPTGASNLLSVSCASPGNCSAVGNYTPVPFHNQAFVVSQVDGVWGSFEDVPGLVVVNTSDNAVALSVSCASPGNCSAVGYYSNISGTQAFVVSQVDGVWGSFEDVAGFATAYPTGNSTLVSVSCASAGNCSAVGGVSDMTDDHLFAVSQVDGVWGNFILIPGLDALNTRHSADMYSVSCASVGNCSAGGSYTNSDGYQAFVVSQVDGVWGQAEPISGLISANTGGEAWMQSVSCASVGNCTAGGSYVNSDGYQAFVVSQVDGVWGSYEDVPGLIAANTRGEAFLSSVSCASAGNCSAVGYYSTGSSSQTFVTSISTPVTDPTTTTDAPTIDSSTTVPSTEVASGSHDPTLAPATTVVVTNLPATGRGSSSTVLVSLMLILSGALVVGGLRRRIS